MAKTYEITIGKRIISAVMGRFAKMGVGNFALLTTTGRKSHQAQTVTVSPIADGGSEYLVSPYGNSAWVLNARANSEATIRRGGSSKVVRLVEVTGQKPGLVRAYYERESFARPFMDVPGDATVDDFATVSKRFPLFRIEAGE